MNKVLFIIALFFATNAHAHFCHKRAHLVFELRDGDIVVRDNNKKIYTYYAAKNRRLTIYYTNPFVGYRNYSSIYPSQNIVDHYFFKRGSDEGSAWIEFYRRWSFEKITAKEVLEKENTTIMLEVCAIKKERK